MEVQIIKPQDQAIGQFDGGKIKEQKPIGFPGEGSLINRLGHIVLLGLGTFSRTCRTWSAST